MERERNIALRFLKKVNEKLSNGIVIDTDEHPSKYHYVSEYCIATAYDIELCADAFVDFVTNDRTWQSFIMCRVQNDGWTQEMRHGKWMSSDWDSIMLKQVSGRTLLANFKQDEQGNTKVVVLTKQKKVKINKMHDETFIDAYIAGRASASDIKEYMKEWVMLDDQPPLHRYLGMLKYECDVLTSSPKALQVILNKYKAEKEYSDIKALLDRMISQASRFNLKDIKR